MPRRVHNKSGVLGRSKRGGVPSLEQPVQPQEIRQQLARILSSDTFRAASGQAAFLRFVTEEALAGRGHLLKEFSIGVEVFRRGEAFDPRSSAIVRLEARKLRLRLGKYYAGEGSGDPVQIEIPKGGYVPSFRAVSLQALPSRTTDPPTMKRTAPPLVPIIRAVRHAPLLAPRESPESGDSVRSLVVLPFLNRGDDPEVHFFSQGLTDELTTTLGRLPLLKVVARSSAVRFRGEGLDVRKIGRDLKVQMVLEGSVRKYGPRLRLTVQLNETTSGYRIWSECYDRDWQDALDLQRELSLIITGALANELFPEVARGARAADGHGSRAEAFQTAAKGRYFWNRHTAQDFETAIDHFERAITEDPGYARPYADLAKTFVMLPFLKMVNLTDLASNIGRMASIALDLDDGLGDAHTAMAVRRIYNFDWPGAGVEFRKGIDLNPNDATSHSWYGTYLLNVGRSQEAMRERAKALELDSRSPLIVHDYGQTFFYLRRFDEAIEYQRRALAIDPKFAIAHIDLGRASIHKGNRTRGIAELERGQHLMRDAPRVKAHLAYAHAVSGNRDRATVVLNEFLNTFKTDCFPALVLAEIYIGLGDKERAFEWLHKAIDQKDWVLFLKSDPLFDSLRPDPRFAVLLKRMNLK